MKIMLWKPGVLDGSNGELPHIGLGILARDIKNCGHDVFIADHHFDPVEDHVPIEILEREKPDILGISIASLEWNLQKTQLMIDLAYKQGIPVWLGGPHVHGYWDLLQNDKRISKIVVGETDGRFQTILNTNQESLNTSQENLNTNQYSLNTSQENLNTNPNNLNANPNNSGDKVIFLGRTDEFLQPDFSCLINAEKMITYPVFTSRGCSHNCAFCAGTKTHGNKWRANPLNETFWHQLHTINIKYPLVKTISVIDDEFTNNLPHAKEFLKRFINDYSHFNLTIFNVRADQIDDELLVLLKKARVENLSIGIESGDPEVFRLVRKGETHETIKQAIIKIQNAGIIPRLNMVIGLPGDSLEAHKRSVDWVTSIPFPRITQWLHYAPFRGTWAYKYFVDQGDFEDGFISELPPASGYDKLPEKGAFNSKGFSVEEKMIAQLEGYLRCYTPILILNDEKVRNICQRNMMMDIYNDWRKNAPIDEYITKFLPSKIAKGQVAKAWCCAT